MLAMIRILLMAKSSLFNSILLVVSKLKQHGTLSNDARHADRDNSGNAVLVG